MTRAILLIAVLLALSTAALANEGADSTLAAADDKTWCKTPGTSSPAPTIVYNARSYRDMDTGVADWGAVNFGFATGAIFANAAFAASGERNAQVASLGVTLGVTSIIFGLTARDAPGRALHVLTGGLVIALSLVNLSNGDGNVASPAKSSFSPDTPYRSTTPLGLSVRF